MGPPSPTGAKPAHTFGVGAPHVHLTHSLSCLDLAAPAPAPLWRGLRLPLLLPLPLATGKHMPAAACCSTCCAQLVPAALSCPGPAAPQSGQGRGPDGRQHTGPSRGPSTAVASARAADCTAGEHSATHSDLRRVSGDSARIPGGVMRGRADTSRRTRAGQAAASARSVASEISKQPDRLSAVSERCLHAPTPAPAAPLRACCHAAAAPPTQPVLPWLVVVAVGVAAWCARLEQPNSSITPLSVTLSQCARPRVVRPVSADRRATPTSVTRASHPLRSSSVIPGAALASLPRPMSVTRGHAPSRSTRSTVPAAWLGPLQALGCGYSGPGGHRRRGMSGPLPGACGGEGEEGVRA